MAENGSQSGDSRLLLELVSGLSVADAAKRARVSERTAYRRLNDPDFCRELSQLRTTIVSQSVGRLISVSVKAVDTLQNLLEAESETVRLGAAKSILEMGIKHREQLEIEERLSRLENQVSETSDRNNGR